MKIMNSLFGSLLLLASSILLSACVSIGSNIHPQPLTLPLSAKSGSRAVQEDWLVSSPTLETSAPVSLKWLNANHLIYAISSEEDREKSEIEILNIDTGMRRR